MRYLNLHRGRVLAYLFVVGMSAFGLWLVEHRADQQADALAVETEARALQGCERANEGRALTREVAAEVGVESAEAVIEVASQGDDPPSPEVVEAYREAVRRRMEQIASRLEDRACEAEAEVRQGE